MTIENKNPIQEAVKPNRDNIRAKVFASDTRKGETALIDFFGTTIELRQPSIGEIQKFGDAVGDDKSIGFTNILIDYAYVPNTDEKVFEEGDVADLNELPFGADVQRVIAAIEKFTNLSVNDAEKN